MADPRTTKNLVLLASLISSSAFLPNTDGLVIPSWGLIRASDEGKSIGSSASSPATDDFNLKANQRTPHSQGLTVKDKDSQVFPKTPNWARKPAADTFPETKHLEDLDRNLHVGNGRFLPVRIARPASQRRPNPFFSSPKRLPTPKILESGMTKQPDPLALLESEILKDLAKAVDASRSDRWRRITPSSSLEQDSNFAKTEDWFRIEDVKMTPIQADSFSPPPQSLPPCGGHINFFSPPQWFEKTGIFIVGMLVMFTLAIGAVEIGDFIWRRLFKVQRRKSSRRRGALWLDGEEKRLGAIQEADEEE